MAIFGTHYSECGGSVKTKSANHWVLLGGSLGLQYHCSLSPRFCKLCIPPWSCLSPLSTLLLLLKPKCLHTFAFRVGGEVNVAVSLPSTILLFRTGAFNILTCKNLLVAQFTWILNRYCFLKWRIDINLFINFLNPRWVVRMYFKMLLYALIPHCHERTIWQDGGWQWKYDITFSMTLKSQPLWIEVQLYQVLAVNI